MQIRVSPEVGNVLDDAATLSIRSGKYFVGVEHLFQAIVNNPSLLPKSTAQTHKAALEKTARVAASSAWTGEPPSVSGEVYYTPRCAAATNEAARLAERLRSAQTGAGHLLLAILADAYSGPSRAMERHGIDRAAILQDLRGALMNSEAGPAKAAVGAAKAEAARAGAPGQPAKGEPAAAPDKAEITLESFTRNLTQAVKDGKLEPAVGRDSEIREMLEILARKGKHNVIIVGEAGVGKTKVIEGLAVYAAKGKLGEEYTRKKIIELNLPALMSGTQYRGAFEEKVLALLAELEKSPDTILFIDEIHMIMGAGSTDGDGMDLANLLKPALGRGDLRCIGATTLQEYRKFIGKDPAIERRFQMVRVESLSPEAALEVLQSLRKSLEQHHGVKIETEALKAAISLTERYLPNRQLPDKAIDVLDQACARYRIRALMGSKSISPGGAAAASAENVITPHTIRKVVSQAAAIPIEDITAEERLRLTDLDRRLKTAIIGQDEAVAKVASAVKKSRAGMADPNRPEAVMLFLGPTGVGKTQLAKELAKSIFGSSNHLVTFDMSEYIESHSVSKLLGAPPGYVGSEQEGRLTGAVQNTPFCILLFDEIEKAHPQIFDIFLPILDEGRLKDTQGRVVSFRNTLIIFTSNIGAESLYRGEVEAGSRTLTDELLKHFRPEFINRIDDIVPFYPLLFEDVYTILKLMIDQLRLRLRDKDIGIRMYQGAYEYLAKEGYNPQFGARELRRTVERSVAGPISELLLGGEYGPGDMIDVLTENEKLAFRKGKPHSKTKAGF